MTYDEQLKAQQEFNEYADRWFRENVLENPEFEVLFARLYGDANKKKLEKKG